jgi:hypothetical protein
MEYEIDRENRDCGQVDRENRDWEMTMEYEIDRENRGIHTCEMQKQNCRRHGEHRYPPPAPGPRLPPVNKKIIEFNFMHPKLGSIRT